MAELVWTDPALNDLDAIADYIAVENSLAVTALVKREFAHVEPLRRHPDSGSRPLELKRSRYRQIIQRPCRVFYRYDGNTVFVLHVLRAERPFRKRAPAARERGVKRWRQQSARHHWFVVSAYSSLVLTPLIHATKRKPVNGGLWLVDAVLILSADS